MTFNKVIFKLIIISQISVIPCSGQFNVVETNDLRLVSMGKTNAYLEKHVARCFENSYLYHRQLFNYHPEEKITVFLHDFSDFGNAAAGTIPNNIIIVGIAPYSYTYETVPANERMNSIMNHELVHIVTLDQTSKSDRFFRSVFMGKVRPDHENPLSMFYGYLTVPRKYSPRWYREGIAVFLDTWMAGGIGRALGAYDEMVFRTMERDSVQIYDLVGLESEGMKTDFQVGVVSYLYGTRFMSYLSYTYGPEKLVQWAERRDGSRAYFASQFKKIYGFSMDNEWSKWIAWEHQFQQANLDRIRANPVTPYKNLSHNPLGSVSRAYYDSTIQKLYAAVNYPGQIAHIAEMDTNMPNIKKICDIKGAALYYVTSLAYDQTEKIIYYTTDNDGWRDINLFDLKSGKSSVLMKDARIGDLVFNAQDKSLWGIRHFNGISTVVRMEYPYRDWKQIYSWPYGKDMYDIDVSHNGKFLSGALAEISGRQHLIIMPVDSLLKGAYSYDILFDFENSNPANFLFSPDDRFLYGSSYYSGVSNIFRYNFEMNDMEALSNCETGFFRPIPVSDDSLIVFRYTGKGFEPVKMGIQPVEKVSAIQYLGQEIVTRYPIVKDWLADSPAIVNIDSMIISTGEYSELSHLSLVSAYPVLEGFKDYAAFGARLNISSPLGLHDMSVTGSYSSQSNLRDSEKIHAGMQYRYMNWKADLKYNYADFYDLFGPTKVSRKGYSAGLRYEKSLLSDLPKSMDLSMFLTHYGDLERLPDYQNIGTTYDRFQTFGAGFKYRNMTSSLGAVDYEKGFEWELSSYNYQVDGILYPHIFMNMHVGFPLAINHSSVWLRNSIGHAWGDRNNPFTNYYFGGFGNNWVDYRPEKRYREYYSFPGLEINAAAGKNYDRFMIEWNLPPLRFRGAGIPSFYMSWARFSLFSSGLITDFDNDLYRRTLINAGLQGDFRLILLSHLKITFSVGYARAFEQEKKASDEFMISLKVL